MMLDREWDIHLQVIVLDCHVDHRIYRLIWVAVNFWGGESWVSACHHCRIVPSDEDAQSLAKVTHHFLLVTDSQRVTWTAFAILATLL